MSKNQRLNKLFESYYNKTASIEERKEMMEIINRSEHDEQLVDEIKKAWEELSGTEPFFSNEESNAIFKKIIHPSAAKVISFKTRLYRHIAVAASILLLLIAGTAIYVLNRVSTKKDIAKTPTTINTKNNDVQPGTEKAVLTLADGTKITIDNTANGAIAQQGNTVVMKEDGLLAYNADQKKPQTEILYNTLTTARGEEFKSLVLADGTKVWLNSVSSIRFPTAFIGKERNVEITGEAYFEVAPNPAMPFKVKINTPSGDGGEVEVFGTHFNVNAYADEATVNTTLLEGRVKVSKNSSAVLLKPGQQAQLINNDQLKLVENADMDAAVAWKNGIFYLNDADIPSVLRQVARWYDIDVEYRNGLPQGHLSGKVPRNMNLSQILKVLEYSEVNFKLEGHKLIVMP